LHCYWVEEKLPPCNGIQAEITLRSTGILKWFTEKAEEVKTLYRGRAGH
jgi:hypothetical protein